MGARINVKDLPPAMQAQYRQKRSIAAKVPLRGEPCTMIWVVLPWCPALNNLYANTAHGRVLSKRGREYKKAVAEACQAQYITYVIGRLTVQIWAHPPDNRKRDLDGVFKAPIDALVAAGVMEDDSQIDHLTIHRESVDKENPHLNIRLCGDYPG